MHSIWQSYPVWTELAPHAASFDCEVLNALKERHTPGLVARFSPQEVRGRRRRSGEKKRRPSYEEEIHLHGRIPTRPAHPHDLYNALIWMTFPHAKMALHARSLALHREGSDPSRRGHSHQRLTGLDEGGLLLAVPSKSQERAREVLDLKAPSDRVDALKSLAHEIFVFGHGLIEVLKAKPASLITAFTLLVDMPEMFFSDPLKTRLSNIDSRLAELLTSEGADPARIGSLPAWLL